MLERIGTDKLACTLRMLPLAWNISGVASSSRWFNSTCNLKRGIMGIEGFSKDCCLVFIGLTC
jgi:hypothetical protein